LYRLWGYALFLILLLFPLSGYDRVESAASIIPEGRDFATLVLGNPWDMSQFSDISQYLNRSGQANLLTNIVVQNGVFSARSTELKQASIHPLFPGYKYALMIGKTGHNYPIDASLYKCIYVAAKVDSGPPENNTPDQMLIYWFGDERLNEPGAIWGLTIPGIVLYPEAGAGTPNPRWKLYSMRLDQASVPAGYTKWQNSPDGKWRGLRIDATLQQTSFQIDWVRLTDCTAVNLSISWSGTGPVSVSIQPDGTTREISVIASTNTNPIYLDTQGLQPGRYTYYIKRGTQIVTSGIFEVNQAPIVDFSRPSFTSGEDYATQTGNPWDMSDQSDLEGARCVSNLSLGNGILSFDTLSGENLSPDCAYGGLADPQFYLNSPTPIDPREYRYLSFRQNTLGDWQNVPGAMIVRWVWQIQGTSSNPDNRCILAGQDIPYDVGWQTYSVDLWDITDGSVKAKVGECPSGLSNWLNSTPALEVRFDPNENALGQTLHQELDWIKLTKMNRAIRGTSYPLELSLNKPWSGLVAFTFYYTSNLSNPQQQVLRLASQVSLPAGFKVFLPTTYGGLGTSSMQNKFLWDTSTVSPGDYYICVSVDDGLNQAVYCSETPVRVQ
jgi:hypothetical protein